MQAHHLSQEDFLAIVEAGIQAPSADNRHLLLFDQVGDAVRVWGNQEFCGAPFHRRILSLLSLGAVAENMVLRARDRGLESAVEWFPDADDPRLAARLTVAGTCVSRDALATAIPQRHTNRRFFHGPSISMEHQNQLETDAAAIKGARLIWLDQRPLRRKALKLIRLAEAERFRQQDLHDELFSSIRFEVGWKDAAEEGLSPGSLEVELPLRSAFEKLRHWRLMRLLTFLGGHQVLAFRGSELPCRFSPHMGVIATTLEASTGALAVGQALERVWLRATSHGMALQPLAASTLLALDGYTEVRPLIRQKLAVGWAELTRGMLPLIVFRLGWSSPVSLRSGRRPVASYLCRGGQHVSAEGIARQPT